MLAHNLKEVLTLIPEARDLVKQANIEADFPVDNKDSVCASYLVGNYLMKVAHKAIDMDAWATVEKAASLYRVKEQLDSLGTGLVKQASVKASYLVEQFLLSRDGIGGIEKTAALAEEIQETLKFSGVPAYAVEDVNRYSGRCYLNKEAAVKQLANRFLATKDEGFKKLAHIVAKDLREDDFKNIQKVCKVATHLDKKAGLDVIGFNFYRDSLIPITKIAALKSSLYVTLGGEQIPYEKISKFGKDRIHSILGKDVADSLTDDHVNNKYALEALPRDLQILLKGQVKGL